MSISKKISEKLNFENGSEIKQQMHQHKELVDEFQMNSQVINVEESEYSTSDEETQVRRMRKKFRTPIPPEELDDSDVEIPYRP